MVKKAATETLSFPITKNMIERLTMVRSISDIGFIERNMFIRDETSSIMIKTMIADIPDDFCIPISKISSFERLCTIFPESKIEYSTDESQKIIKIINKNSEDNFIEFVKAEYEHINDHGRNLPKERQEKFEKSYKSPEALSKSAVFELKSEDIQSIEKIGKSINANLIDFYSENSELKIKVHDSKGGNAHKYKKTISNCEVKIELFTSISFELFEKINTNSDYSVIVTNKGTVILENEDEQILYCIAPKREV